MEKGLKDFPHREGEDTILHSNDKEGRDLFISFWKCWLWWQRSGRALLVSELLIVRICITTEILFTEFIGVIKSHLSYTETRPLLLLVKQVFLFLFCIFLVLLVCRGFPVII